MGLVGLLITLIVEVVMLYWPGRLLIKIIVLVDFKGCQIFFDHPLIYLYLYEKSVLSVFGCGAGHSLYA